MFLQKPQSIINSICYRSKLVARDQQGTCTTTQIRILTKYLPFHLYFACEHCLPVCIQKVQWGFVQRFIKTRMNRTIKKL